MFLKPWFSAGMLAMGLTLAGCFPAANSQDEEKNPYFIAGKDRAAARDYAGAVEAFEKALEVNPRSALAHYELGVLYEQRESDYPAAIYHYNKVLKLRPHGAYPAENARQRIPGCKLEMLKNDTLATLNPAAMREIERLRKENQDLRQSLAAWNDWWKQNATRVQQSYVPARPADAAPVIRYPTPGANPGAASAATRNATSAGTGAGTAARTLSGRTHQVKKGETITKLAREYGVTVDAVLAANPGLEPRRIKVGQQVNIP